MVQPALPSLFVYFFLFVCLVSAGQETSLVDLDLFLFGVSPVFPRFRFSVLSKKPLEAHHVRVGVSETESLPLLHPDHPADAAARQEQGPVMDYQRQDANADRHVRSATVEVFRASIRVVARGTVELPS